MSKELNMTIAGVTGQGIMMATKILATALLADGNKVKTTDVPPASHRLSSTYSHIRCGEDIYDVSVSDGETQLFLGLEPVECLRTGLRYASKDGLVIMNDRLIKRLLVAPWKLKSSELTYPTTDEILDYFRRVGVTNVKHLDASDVSMKETGSVMSLNMVMVGLAIASGMVPTRVETVENCLKTFSPGKTADLNLKAFRAGIEKFKELN